MNYCVQRTNIPSFFKFTPVYLVHNYSRPVPAVDMTRPGTTPTTSPVSVPRVVIMRQARMSLASQPCLQTLEIIMSASHCQKLELRMNRVKWKAHQRNLMPFLRHISTILLNSVIAPF